MPPRISELSARAEVVATIAVATRAVALNAATARTGGLRSATVPIGTPQYSLVCAMFESLREEREARKGDKTHVRCA
ncbi:MAG: hypothetical protein CVT64_09330 [Actinobacteria bacterium HGW-Actinobacteria-4]|nr:MAG: hypothetical protein CVT64_09330 [Actinobacteria bacterium HGW-Actinobacteria-4]